MPPPHGKKAGSIAGVLIALAALSATAATNVPTGDDKVFMSIEDGEGCEVEMKDGEVLTEGAVLKASSEEPQPVSTAVSTAVGAPESTYAVFRVDEVPVITDAVSMWQRPVWGTYDIAGTLYALFGSSLREAKKATQNAVSDSRPEFGRDIAKLITEFVPDQVASATMRFASTWDGLLAQLTPSGKFKDTTSGDGLTAAFGLPGNTGKTEVYKKFTVVWALYPTETPSEGKRGTGWPGGPVWMQIKPLTEELKRLGLARLANPEGKNAEMKEKGVPWNSGNNAFEMQRVLPTLKVSDLIVWQIGPENEGMIKAWFNEHKDRLQI